MTSRTFTHVPAAGDEAFAIRLPFDPKEAFGRTRAAVIVEVNGHRYRSTVTTMGGSPWVPFRKSNRDAAQVREGAPVEITVSLDAEARTVDAPADLRAALEEAGAWERWTALSYTHQREHVEAIESAKRPETRERRIAKCVATTGIAAPSRQR